MALRLDFDSKLISRNAKRITEVIEFFRLDIINVIITESKRGYHIEMECVNLLNDYQICFIQLAMKSDFRRECFNLLRVSSGQFKSDEWNVLFTEKILMQI